MKIITGDRLRWIVLFFLVIQGKHERFLVVLGQETGNLSPNGIETKHKCTAIATERDKAR